MHYTKHDKRALFVNKAISETIAFVSIVVERRVNKELCIYTAWMTSQV